MSNNEESKDYEQRDVAFMKKAIELLSECPECEVPVAAIVVYNDEIVGVGVNRRETDSDPTAHAEVVAIRDAAKKLGRWNLSDCELYVTLEPCVMCGGAIVYSRISRVVFGAYDLRFGACGTALDVVRCDKLNHRAEVVGGVLDKECLKPITDFFKARRK
ncbi:MAG: tRNA adenosine(34) deaminase TadA [Clostridiales bacterium]|nr:tRNA adenosine(34) deaminase TadA [Clostridiales bacterium]